MPNSVTERKARNIKVKRNIKAFRPGDTTSKYPKIYWPNRYKLSTYGNGIVLVRKSNFLFQRMKSTVYVASLQGSFEESERVKVKR